MNDVPAEAATLSSRTAAAAREALDGRRRGVRALLPIAGPSLIISVAYVDPGNYATNIQAGAHAGYGLLWVVWAASLLGIFFQSLSAKLGIATGRNLPELCADHLPRPAVFALWIASEAVAMATDLAELLGGGLGLSLLLGQPLWVGVLIAAAATLALLSIQRWGFRPMELAIGSLLGLIGVCYLVELAIAPVDWGRLAGQALRPRIQDATSLQLALGILGATVMPHVIYLHSDLTSGRVAPPDAERRRRLLRYSNLEVALALGFAGLVNMAMLIMSAAVFHGSHGNVAEIEAAYRTLAPLLGPLAAGVFLTSLIASGLSSSTVGTMAGQIIMQGFVRFSIPLWLRRLVTMAPCVALALLGVDVTDALVYSQIFLSLLLPIPLLALLAFTANRRIMGEFVNARGTTLLAGLATAAVLLFNGAVVAEMI